MNAQLLLILGFATAINLLLIFWKVTHGRFSDAAVDGGILFILAYMTHGTLTGFATSIVASSIVSLYLLFFPPKEFLKL